MNFKESIISIKKQLSYNFQIENNNIPKGTKDFLLIGMGGSALSGGIMKGKYPSFPISVHKDYGLPETKKDTLLIFSSYSGNTEEVIDGLKIAKRKRLKIAIISKGGKILEIAKKDNLPYIKIPDYELQPRMALGFSFNALLKITGQENKILKDISKKINFNSLEKEGREISKKLKDKIPLIYSSYENLEIGYNWKIKFNENGKIPSFSNHIPESNHNEISGFNKRTKEFSNNIVPIFLEDDSSHARIKKRIDITKKIYQREGFKTISVPLKGKEFLEKYFISSTLADFITLNIANLYGFDPLSVPTIEKLKKLLKKP